MDKDRKNGVEKLNLSKFLGRFLNLCIVLGLLDFFLIFNFLSTHDVTLICVCINA